MINTRCPKCQRKAYTRRDGSVSCQQCGYGLKPKFMAGWRCPVCNKPIAYIRCDGQAKCRTCGIIKPTKVSNNEIASNAMAQG